MNVLLTGGAGFIGSHIAVLLGKNNCNVVLYDNLSNSTFEVVKKINQLSKHEIILVEGDIRDLSNLTKTFNSHEIDAVIHLAGKKAVYESTQFPLNYYDNNVSGTLILLEAMDKCNINNLVFSGSATVYGNPNYLPIDESHPLCPTNPYANSKAQIEVILSDLSKSDSNKNFVSLRYFNPIGCHESGLIGENPIGIPNNLIPYIAKVALGKIEHLTVFGNDFDTKDGTGVRDYIHVMDLADAHLKALDYSVHNMSQLDQLEIFNLGTGHGYSVFEVLEAYSKCSNIKIPYEIHKRRDGDIAISLADASKAKKLLNWSPQYNLEQMCSSSWNFTLKSANE